MGLESIHQVLTAARMDEAKAEESVQTGRPDPYFYDYWIEMSNGDKFCFGYAVWKGSSANYPRTVTISAIDEDQSRVTKDSPHKRKPMPSEIVLEVKDIQRAWFGSAYWNGKKMKY